MKNSFWEQFYNQENTFGVTEETHIVRATYDAIPDEFQPTYHNGLHNAVMQSNGPAFIKHSLAVCFEMSRLDIILRQGVETLSLDAKKIENPDGIEFQSFTLPEHAPKNKKIAIENDIPIERDGKPFVYEAKCRTSGLMAQI